MDFEPTEEQRLIIDTTRRFVREEIVPLEADLDPDASELLYAEGLEFQTEYEVDEDVLADRLKKTSTVFDALHKRHKIDTRSIR